VSARELVGEIQQLDIEDLAKLREFITKRMMDLLHDEMIQRATGLGLADSVRLVRNEPALSHDRALVSQEKKNKGGRPPGIHTPHKDRKFTHFSYLPETAEAAIVAALRANEGRATGRELNKMVREALKLENVKVSALNQSMRRKLDRMVDAKRLLVLAEPAGPGTSYLYGLAEMIEQNEEAA
jgi:hypothetical protein